VGKHNSNFSFAFHSNLCVFFFLGVLLLNFICIYACICCHFVLVCVNVGGFAMVDHICFQLNLVLTSMFLYYNYVYMFLCFFKFL